MKHTNNAIAKTVLIGEDDIDDEEILEEVVESIDPSIRIQFMNNGQKMIEFLEEIKDEDLPCLIILDYNMPGLNGAEILKRVHRNERLKHVPKIIWSTSNAATYKKICMESGASDYLVKPNKIKDLENMIRHMLSYCKS
ncbi:MAG: response regulator [Ginsengibacter sp.]|jgi:CheY-like chemotaxis protein